MTPATGAAAGCSVLRGVGSRLSAPALPSPHGGSSAQGCPQRRGSSAFATASKALSIRTQSDHWNIVFLVSIAILKGLRGN